MKKILALLLAFMIVMTSFAGCSGNVDDTSANDSESVSDALDSSDAVSDDTDSDPGDIDIGFGSDNDGYDFSTDIEISENDPDAETNDVSASDIADAVKELMGDDYLPSESLDNEYLEMTYGVKPEWIDNYYAEIPMISFHIDTFIAVKAVAGEADNVQNALEDYLAYTIENSHQYPVNIPKLNASRVYRLGDYVFYIMLGSAPDEYMDDEAASYDYCVQSNQNIVEKINELLLK